MIFPMHPHVLRAPLVVIRNQLGTIQLQRANCAMPAAMEALEAVVCQILWQFVHGVQKASTKHSKVGPFASRANLERTKTILVRPNVKSAALGDIKIHLATTLVWIAKLVNT